MGRPDDWARSTSAGSRSSPLPVTSSSRRSTSRVDRSSRAASLLASWIASSASEGSSPFLRARWAATPACTLITEMLWVSESCSSRAIRSRSSTARRRATSSRVRSASSARLSTSRMRACHCTDATTPNAAETSQPVP